jgi:hypothetical protein
MCPLSCKITQCMVHFSVNLPAVYLARPRLRAYEYRDAFCLGFFVWSLFCTLVIAMAQFALILAGS